MNLILSKTLRLERLKFVFSSWGINATYHLIREKGLVDKDSDGAKKRRSSDVEDVSLLGDSVCSSTADSEEIKPPDEGEIIFSNTKVAKVLFDLVLSRSLITGYNNVFVCL